MAHHIKLVLAMLLGVPFMPGTALQAGAVDLPSYELDTVI